MAQVNSGGFGTTLTQARRLCFIRGLSLETGTREYAYLPFRLLLLTSFVGKRRNVHLELLCSPLAEAIHAIACCGSA